MVGYNGNHVNRLSYLLNKEKLWSGRLKCICQTLSYCLIKTNELKKFCLKTEWKTAKGIEGIRAPPAWKKETREHNFSQVYTAYTVV